MVLCFAPIGRAISLDRVRAVRAARLADSCRRSALYQSVDRRVHPADADPDGGAVLLQRHQQDWRRRLVGGGRDVEGVHHRRLYNAPCSTCSPRQYWLVNLATYVTLLIEISFAFLIWQRADPALSAGRGAVPASAVRHPDGDAVFLLGDGHGSHEFRAAGMAQPAGPWWKRRIGDMEMIYDGRCGFCVRSMAWFLAFDGLGRSGCAISGPIPRRSLPMP